MAARKPAKASGTPVKVNVDPGLRLETTSVEVPDTGIGQEAGYADDAALIAAEEERRAHLSPGMRAIEDKIDRHWQHAAIYGEPRP